MKGIDCTIYTTLNLWLFEAEKEIDVRVEVSNFIPGTPGRYTGLPENCYPAEGPEWDGVRVFVDEDGNKKGEQVELPWQFIDGIDIDSIIEEKCMEEGRDREIAHEEAMWDAEREEKMIRGDNND
jgi:hypothetical protein